MPHGTREETHCTSDMKYHFLTLESGFTLAEVLITLGVIGVVAALTLPSVIQKHQHKVLESQLKKAMSIHSQAMMQTKNSLGVGNFYQTFLVFDGVDYTYKDLLEEEYLKSMKVAGKCTYSISPRNYNNTNEAYMDKGATAKPKYLAPDGSCFQLVLNSYTIGITVDVNGAKKRPNQLGHDIFVFYVDDNDFLVPMKTTKNYSQDEIDQLPDRDPDNPGSSPSAASVEQRGYPCTTKNNQKGNGIGCAWYALQDICPDDPTKKYWECLP